MTMDLEYLKQLARDDHFSELNRLVMEDTLKMCQSEPDLVNAVANSISDQYIVFWNEDLEVSNKAWNSNIIVSNEWNKWIIDNYGWDDIIYVPDVVIFKTDVSIPELLNKSDWYKVDVIVSAAPEFWRWYPYSESKFKDVIKKRIKRILDVASKEKVDVLILWAFGCGAFQNPPEIVAQTFKDELKNYDFKTVEFAIHSRKGRPNQNFEIFDKVFTWKEYIDLSRFIDAQRGTYEIAMKELRNWKKQSHRMWYIFPQIRWLWHSENAEYYAIKNWKEARAYYNDKILWTRLHELCKSLIGLSTSDAKEIFWPIDSIKLCSCITLFLQVSPRDKILQEVLDKFFGWEYDINTLTILNNMQN